jgi:hypothetical protein
MMEGVNSTMIHYKNFCKCHNVPPEQQYLKKKNRVKTGQAQKGEDVKCVHFLLTVLLTSAQFETLFLIKFFYLYAHTMFGSFLPL